MKKISALFLTFAMLVLCTGFLTAQDWPQWRGINRDCVVTGFKEPPKWPAELTQVWKIQVGFGDASPALSGNKIYLNTRQGDNEVILCLDAKTGKELWKDQYPSPAVTGPSASQHSGPRSSPAVGGGKVVTFGADAIISCLDASTGKVFWRKDNPGNAIPQFYTGMSPLIVNNVCIVYTGSKDNGQVVAFDLATGKEMWKWTGDGPSYASPSLMTADGKKMLVVQSEKNLLALNPDNGTLLWTISTPPQQRFYNSSSPYINGNIIYYTGQGAGIKAIKVTGTGNPSELWSNTEVGAKWNTPVLKDGFLYGFSDQKRIYCVNAESGKTAWIDNTVNSDFSTLSDCGTVLIGLASTGNLIVFKPVSASYTEIAKYKVTDKSTYSYPIIAGSLIYVKDTDSLILYSIK